MTTTPAAPLPDLAQQIVRQQSELKALQRDYETRQSTLADLNRQKAELKAQLQQLNEEIKATTEGSPSEAFSSPGDSAEPTPRPTQPRTPAKTAPASARGPRPNTLSALLLEILQHAGGPMTAKQLAEEVVRRKFKTSSKNIPALIHNIIQGLVKRRLLRRISRKKGYALGKGAAPAPARNTTASPQAGPKLGPATKKELILRDGQKQQLPLRTLLTNILAKSRRPVTARELADQVLASGYQTKSKNFMEVMWVALSQMKNIKKVPDKGYILKR